MTSNKRVFREGDIVEDKLQGGIWKVVLDEDNNIDTVPISQVNDVDFDLYGLSLSRVKEMEDKFVEWVWANRGKFYQRTKSEIRGDIKKEVF